MGINGCLDFVGRIRSFLAFYLSYKLPATYQQHTLIELEYVFNQCTCSHQIVMICLKSFHPELAGHSSHKIYVHQYSSKRYTKWLPTAILRIKWCLLNCRSSKIPWQHLISLCAFPWKSSTIPLIFWCAVYDVSLLLYQFHLSLRTYLPYHTSSDYESLHHPFIKLMFQECCAIDRYQGQGQVITSHIYCGIWLLVPAIDTCFWYNTPRDGLRNMYFNGLKSKTNQVWDHCDKQIHK